MKFVVFIAYWPRLMEQKRQSYLMSNGFDDARFSENSVWLVYAFLLTYSAYGVSLIVWPVLWYYMTGDVLPNALNRIPGIDSESHNGRYILTIIHSYEFMVGVPLFALLDGFTAIFAYNTLRYSGLITSQMHSIDRGTVPTKMELTKIVELHAKMNE